MASEDLNRVAEEYAQRLNELDRASAKCAEERLDELGYWPSREGLILVLKRAFVEGIIYGNAVRAPDRNPAVTEAK